jgi:formiminoglutamase
MLIQSSYNKLDQYTSIRAGETKLGQVLNVQKENILEKKDLNNLLSNQSAPYVLVGIPEDIGVRANYGKGGSEKAFDSFLSYFCNIQHNQFFNNENLFLLGEIYVNDLQNESNSEVNIKRLRDICSQVDERVFPVIEAIVLSGKTPIIIGGGHNNSYGNIKGTSLALNRKIDILNIDPHADFRAEEGRHSGNGFSYAYSQNYIDRYGIWSLHENYNNQTILDSFTQNSNLFFESFDNMLRDTAISFDQFLGKFSNDFGLELDLDSIKNMPTSAITPVGYTEEEVLDLLIQVSKSKKVLYYHLAEGSPQVNNSYKVGKFLAYAVTTIIKT